MKKEGFTLMVIPHSSRDPWRIFLPRKALIFLWGLLFFLFSAGIGSIVGGLDRIQKKLEKEKEEYHQNLFLFYSYLKMYNKLSYRLESLKREFFSDEEVPLREYLAFLRENARVYASFPRNWPVLYGMITSSFGERPSPFEKAKEFHRGIDVAIPSGTPVYATADGEVIGIGENPYRGYGYYVKLQHPFGILTLYAHNSKVLVVEGDKVKRGEIIAYSGETGLATGPHLHYEVRIRKLTGEEIPIDPYPFMLLP